MSNVDPRRLDIHPVAAASLATFAYLLPAGWAPVTVAAIAWVTGALLSAVIVCCWWRRRAHVLVEQAALWQRHATHDSLTGLANRAEVYAWLDRYDGQRYGVVFIDLDNFKVINDEYGHATGDLVLHHVAQLLDHVTHGHGLAARLGGDEFLLLTEDPESVSWLAEQAAGRLRARPAVLGKHLIRCSASFGVATTATRSDPQLVLGQAEAAAYRAKHVPRRVVIFDPGRDQPRISTSGLAALVPEKPYSATPSVPTHVSSAVPHAWPLPDGHHDGIRAGGNTLRS
jgi:diguanylate cyclase (GGDEF)-like protein